MTDESTMQMQSEPGSVSIALPAARSAPCKAEAIEWEELGQRRTTPQYGGPRILSNDTINLRVTLGSARICRDEASRLRMGSIVSLDDTAGDGVAIYADNQLIARGMLVTVDGNFGVRVTEMFSSVAEN